MIISNVVYEDFVNYKKPSLFIGFPKCTFKCNKEYGKVICQNYDLQSDNVIICPQNLIDTYKKNNISKSFVFGGLEPFDSWEDLSSFVKDIRDNNINDDIVIYTGYYENEISEQIKILKNYKNIIIKFGRYIPNQNPHYDEIIGVQLASNNQYAKKIS